MGGRRDRRGGRTTPKGTRPRSRVDPREDVGDPFVEVRAALREPGPGGLLAFASMVVESATPPAWEPRADPQIDLALFVQVLEHDDRRESTALLAALATLLASDERRSAVEAALHGRSFDGLPRWVADLGAAEATSTWALRHVFDDDEQALIGLRWPGGHEATVSVLVRRNLGVCAMDGVIYPVPVDAVLDHARASFAAEPGARVEEFDAAQLRAWVLDAVERGASTITGYDTDTWPESRPLVRWACSVLPTGGAVPQPEAIGDRELDVVVDGVLASQEAASSQLDASHVGLVRALARWSADEGGAADPLLWSPQRVELALLDWLPRQVDLSAEELDAAPSVLRVLVLHGSRVHRLPVDLMAETIDAVARNESDYREVLAADN
jgi:hypothetical protein